MENIDIPGDAPSTIPKCPREGTAIPSSSQVSIPGSQDVEDDPPASQDLKHWEHVGTFRDYVVGVQYYRGLVGEGESVMLRRDPANEYDSNAIQVVNAGGDQVGHLRRGLAMQLASYMDSNKIFVEGRMAEHNLDGFKHYELGLDLSIYRNRAIIPAREADDPCA
ncbi:hypothetical protein L198_01244 [Cryptococcus wingfieldii CBS 7118]|uniref:HIRAN domain-containing protein n=1 Tax=Cryptococcus wingfieldii CBS 7118 TaxID=1295528 RepID=A0A1E3K0K4_9TREE|nr:hypothetical protein L198_01244 [Cryptococcus wingfieldii CBS 7118]ODO06017.1 hypothetical protein L198_01244 [Cryptococcus wingfieldii CBS 7118]